jgi:hypothetical protein
MAFLGESPNVILEGFIQLLLATLQIIGVAGPHVCAMEVAGEDLLEILLVINCVSWQVVELSPGHVDEVNGEKLDDEEVVIRPARPTHEAIVFQPNIRVGFAIILDDVVRHLEMFQETRVAHIAPERLGPWPLGAEAMPLSIVAPTRCELCVRCSECVPSSPQLA